MNNIVETDTKVEALQVSLCTILEQLGGKMLEEYRGLSSSFCWGVGGGEQCVYRALQEHGRGSRTVPEGCHHAGGEGRLSCFLP